MDKKIYIALQNLLELNVSETVFECRKCGQCCEGRGGIVLSAKDVARLSAFLNETAEQTRKKWTEVSNGKIKIRTGSDGRCVFFRSGAGCLVHEGKPDICRAWPFFRGNLQDPVSLEMARDFCPGISRKASFAQFVAEGLEYLRGNGLLAHDGSVEANALIIDSIKKQPACKEPSA